MNSKEKAIELAWMKEFEKVGLSDLFAKKLFSEIKVDENGFYWSGKRDDTFEDVNLIKDNFDFIFNNEFEKSGKRPISLQGIETNNGWIKIESEKDLPSEDCKCHIEFSDGSISIDRYFNSTKMFNSNYWKKNIVAYQKVEQPKKRIY